MGVTARLFVLVLIAILPALAIQTYGEIDLRRAREMEVRENASRLAHFASDELESIANGARALLTAFVKVTSVVGHDGVRCSEYAADLKEAFPEYAVIGAVSLDGTVFCASQPFDDVNAADRPWFQGTLASGRFTVGEYTIARTAQIAGLRFSLPIVDGTGQIDGIAYVLLDLLWLAALINEKPIDGSASLAIADRNGTVLARLPENDRFAGTKLADIYMPYVDAAAPGTAEVQGMDGITRILGYVPPRASTSGLYTAVGLAKEDAFASVDRAGLRGFVMIATGLALGLLAATIGARRFILNPIRKLSNAAGQWAKGDFGARTAISAGSSEFAGLGATFDTMAVQLERRDAERDQSEAKLRELATQLERAAAGRAEAAEALRRLNETLEERVTNETAGRLSAEEALRQAQKMEALGHLTGGVAHDFNNLLQAISGHLELLGMYAADEATSVPADIVRKTSGAAMRATDRGAAITSRLLAFARRQPLAPVPIDVNQLISGMSALLRRTMGETIKSETVLAGSLWHAFADPNQLESALINLAINARDAMPNGGKLTIEAANSHLDDDYARAHGDVVAGPYVLISVSDTGVGMANDVLKRAFDPFFTTKGPGQGTGLGLSQVYGFAKQSNGHVKIYSTPGQGSTISLYLPRANAPAMTRPEKPSPSTTLRRHENVLVLLVEDDEEVRAGAVAMLRKLGFNVLEASDAETALAILDGRKDIVLLFTDIGLPGLNGRELAEEAVQRLPTLKVLYTSGYARNAIVHSGRLDPGVQLLSKPYTLAGLTAKLIEILDS